MKTLNFNKIGAYAIATFAALFTLAVVATVIYLVANHHIDLSSRY